MNAVDSQPNARSHPEIVNLGWEAIIIRAISDRRGRSARSGPAPTPEEAGVYPGRPPRFRLPHGVAIICSLADAAANATRLRGGFSENIAGDCFAMSRRAVTWASLTGSPVDNPALASSFSFSERNASPSSSALASSKIFWGLRPNLAFLFLNLVRDVFLENRELCCPLLVARRKPRDLAHRQVGDVVFFVTLKCGIMSVLVRLHRVIKDLLLGP
jgi:hypothetical protein